MPAGRPPGLTLDPEHPGPVSHGTVEIDSRGRALLPTAIIQEIDWLSKTPGSVDSLAILARTGLLILGSWTELAGPVVERRRELIAKAVSDLDALEALRILEGKYKRLRIPADRRPTLTPEILLHLAIPPSRASTVYLTRVLGRLELGSVSYRNQMLSRVWEELEGLPE